MTIAEAIAEFREAANNKADGIKPARKDHALHARMSNAFSCLMSHGTEGAAAFAALLRDESPHVRVWVSTQLRSSGDTSALPVLEELASSPGIRGFSAEMTLEEYRAGRLRSPFCCHNEMP